jgi:hypothetical protein
MGNMVPRLSIQDLHESAAPALRGGKSKPLPGVKTDAWQMENHPIEDDVKAHTTNRKMAHEIAKVVEKYKGKDKHGPRFILGWRLYANQEHPDWKKKHVHVCGCACSCASVPLPPHDPTAAIKASKAAAKKASGKKAPAKKAAARKASAKKAPARKKKAR